MYIDIFCCAALCLFFIFIIKVRFDITKQKKNEKSNTAEAITNTATFLRDNNSQIIRRVVLFLFIRGIIEQFRWNFTKYFVNICYKKII